MASEDPTLKWIRLSVKPTLVVFIIFMPALCSSDLLNCSEPSQVALLHALGPVFNLSTIRPVIELATPIEVTTFFTLYGILGVDEKAQLLITYIWLNYWWKNEFAVWDPDQCGVSKISLPRKKFWVPDIVINEFMDENTAPSVPYVYLHSDGTVRDAQPVKIISSCNLDIYTFPFDIQNCTLTFNSYLHYALDVRIVLGRPADEITQRSKDVITTMGEWELLDISSNKISDDVEHGVYTDKLAFHIRVRRRPTLYVVNLLIPSCFLITVDLFSFLLPPQNVDRSSFKMTLILGYTVFLLIMNDLLPATGSAIPLINVFFSLCLALMVASLLETILITNLLCGSAEYSPVPHWIRVLVLQFLGVLVGLPQKTKKPKDSDLKISTVVSKGKADAKPPGVENKAVQELKNLSKDLQAIRLQVEQQLNSRSSSEEWIQCCPLKVKSSKVLFIFISLLMHAQCNSIMLPCSQPDSSSLLAALQPVFKLKSIRPVMNISTVTNVTIDFMMFGILGVDEKAQILTTYIWQVLYWTNEFITWNATECGKAWITVPRKLIWVPDIVINEFMGKNSAPFVPYCYLFSNGRVIDARPIRVVSSCRLDIYLFPFDIQNCTLSFNSYLHGRSAMQLEAFTYTEDLYHYSKEVMTSMGEWELIGLTVKKLEMVSSFDDSGYQELRFYVTVRRRATLYVVNLLIPSSFLITVDLFSFLLPPKNVDRSLFKMTLILGYTVFLIIMNNLLPITGETIPLINVFLSLCLGLMVASLLETILITNLMYGSAHYSPVPRWIRVLVLQILGKLVRLPPKPRVKRDTVFQNPAVLEILEMKSASLVAEDSEAPEEKGLLSEDEALQELKNLSTDLQAIRLQVEQQLNVSESSEEWIQVGSIIDRLLFGFYILFITVSFIAIIIIWVVFYNNP